MELRDALSQISEIRLQMARGQTFRGYRSATSAFSGIAAVLAALIQAEWIPDAGRHPGPYLRLWVTVAALSVIVVGIEMAIRCRRSGSRLQGEMTMLAVEQFLPSIVAGALVTFVLARYVPDNLWMLPGLWAILMGLGAFASRRVLPPATFVVGAFYLIAGVYCLSMGRGEAAFSPWTMRTIFGAGQFLAAGVLYWTLERSNVPE